MCFGLSLKEKQSLCRFIVYPQEKEEGAPTEKTIIACLSQMIRYFQQKRRKILWVEG